MTTANLMSLPVDIAWKRLAFSPDMFDTDFDNASLPPKWRSSLTAFYYVVPEENTAEAYPDQKVVYLKVSCSITGFNLSEELGKSINLKHIEGGDAVQKSVWEALQAAGGWTKKYLPCYGAILQVAVYPHSSAGKVSLWDYPYIADFEPKKREMYETRTETGEVLSGSNDEINLKKGTTTTESTEESDIFTGMSTSATALGSGGSFSMSGEWGTRKKSASEETNVTQTNASQQRRETLSASTTISQMYQLFNGYHLGTNRALFFMLPRPHTTEDKETINPNLINGPRRLEGVQEVFLVVVMPKDAVGFCFQANLDTAHPESAPDGPILLMTRRRIQSCAQFSPSLYTILDIAKVGLDTTSWFQKYGLGPAVGSIQLAKAVPTFQMSVMEQPASQHHLANAFNSFLQSEVHNAMLRAYSSSAEPLRPIWESEPVRMAVAEVLRASAFNTATLADLGYLSRAEARRWSRLGLRRVSEFFAPERMAQAEARATRDAIVNRVIGVFQRRPME